MVRKNPPRNKKKKLAPNFVGGSDYDYAGSNDESINSGEPVEEHDEEDAGSEVFGTVESINFDDPVEEHDEEDASSEDSGTDESVTDHTDEVGGEKAADDTEINPDLSNPDLSDPQDPASSVIQVGAPVDAVVRKPSSESFKVFQGADAFTDEHIREVFDYFAKKAELKASIKDMTDCVYETAVIHINTLMASGLQKTKCKNMIQLSSDFKAAWVKHRPIYVKTNSLSSHQPLATKKNYSVGAKTVRFCLQHQPDKVIKRSSSSGSAPQASKDDRIKYLHEAVLRLKEQNSKISALLNSAPPLVKSNAEAKVWYENIMGCTKAETGLLDDVVNSSDGGLRETSALWNTSNASEASLSEVMSLQKMPSDGVDNCGFHTINCIYAGVEGKSYVPSKKAAADRRIVHGALILESKDPYFTLQKDLAKAAIASCSDGQPADAGAIHAAALDCSVEARVFIVNDRGSNS
jgi:hypothetical protein